MLAVSAIVQSHFVCVPASVAWEQEDYCARTVTDRPSHGFMLIRNCLCLS